MSEPSHPPNVRAPEVSATRRGLEDWDSRAIVRTRPNTYDLSPKAIAAFGEQAWFEPHGLPFTEHPGIEHLGERQRQQLLALIRLQFFEYGTVLEHEVVNLTTLELVQRDNGLMIPDAFRVDAYKVYADEAYHALLTMQAADHLKRYIGIEARSWPPRDARLDAIRAAVAPAPGTSDKDAFLRRFGATVLTEIMISKELAESLRGVVIQPIYHFLRDHLHDESRHAVFYAALFEVVWAQLTRREQVALAVALPPLLLAFNRHDDLGLISALRWVGLSEAEAEVIVGESYAPDHTLIRARARASPVLRLLERQGALALPEVRAAFADHGFELSARAELA